MRSRALRVVVPLFVMRGLAVRAAVAVVAAGVRRRIRAARRSSAPSI